MNDLASHKASQGAVTPANYDRVLLRRYAEEGSEAAFAELVRRHVDLVYGAALRRTGGDAHQAADVAQQVFTALARDARKLSRHAVLGAWLHTATRNAALNLMISEQRRQARELQVLALHPAVANDGGAPDWDRLRPVLDAAIDELPETDRAAVVLRFLERRPFAEIGAVLRVSEDAARMRTDRALDKLRAALARRGITSTAAALGVIVSSQPLLSAPAGLAAGLTSGALAAASVGAGALSSGLILLMTTKTTLLTAGAFIVLGVGIYFGLNRDLPVPVPAPEAPRDSQLVDSLRQDNLALRAEVDRLKGDVGQLTAANAQLTTELATPPPPAPAPKTPALSVMIASQQKAMINNLRQIAAARDQYVLENGKPPASVRDLVGATAYIKALRSVAGEDYSELSMTPGQPLSVAAPGTSVNYDPTTGATTVYPEPPPPDQHTEELKQWFAPLARAAVEAYRVANNGNSPQSPDDLLPYLNLTTPQDRANFAEISEVIKAASH